MEKGVDIFQELLGSFSSERWMPVRFQPPTHPSALEIWCACGLPQHAVPYDILESVLQQWAVLHVHQERIQWKSGSVSLETSWDTFLKWFLMSCAKVQ
jgi:hypothetical protein